MIIKEISEQQFNDFNSKFIDSSLYQTNEYAKTMSSQDFDTLILGLVDNDDILGATIILVEKTLGFRYAYAPRGFLIDYNNNELVENFTKEIKKYLSRKDIMAVKLNPLIKRSIYNPKTNKKEFNGDHDIILNNLRKLGYTHLGFNNQFEALKPRFECIIDISNPYEEIFLSFKKDLKNKIRSAENNEIKIIKSNISKLDYLYLQTKRKYKRDLEYFNDLYNNFEGNIDFFYAKVDTAAYLNKVKEKYEYYEMVSSEINNDIEFSKKNKDKIISKKIDIDLKLNKYKNLLTKAIKMNHENKDGIVVASGLFIRQKDKVHLIMDGYDADYRDLNAKHLLIWRAIEHYNKLGYKTLNLGGITNIDVKDKYDGLNQFKLAFNGKAYEYIGDFELITNQSLYFMYRHTKPIASILKI
jgi:lipid II:glycine glycyltransferase (peptidoglycan interpeptide bridge formation enzyme)